MRFVLLGDLWFFIVNVGGFDDAELLRVFSVLECCQYSPVSS